MQNLKNETAGTWKGKTEATTKDVPSQVVAISIEAATSETLKKLSYQISNDIDEFCKTSYDDGFRSHLGASMIGRECSRELWYSFRWVKPSSFNGRMLRLFNRGHREEERFIEWLEGIGAKVWADDLENNSLLYHPESGSYRVLECSKLAEEMDDLELDVSTFGYHVKIAKALGVKFPQYRVSGVEGHFGGSMDGFCKLPERYGISSLVLLEFKTNGTGAAFNKLRSDGMKLTKKEHFAQTSTYGRKGVTHEGGQVQFTHVLYMNINKNDDSIHVELVKLDYSLGEQLECKAERLILSQSPPQRLSDNPTYMKCGYCDYKDVCHSSAPVAKNCRSCKFAQPMPGAKWFCNKFNGELPKDFIKEGCVEHSSINVAQY